MSDGVARDLRLVVGRLARRLRQLHAAEHEGDRTSFIELGVLTRLVREGPSSPTRLAAGERVTSQAVTAAVSELVHRGHLRRRPDPDDGRRVLVEVTDTGRAALHAREQVLGDRLAHVVAGLTAAERTHLASVIPLLEKVADEL
ncbi:MarR family winged helix-turn-helix transcriptional regulator [Micromonospora auratinigra]|uniref:DNA-binding transcriptional regulator, MarR family n=1 Tax=Micromonospora auratinigra TaxID=261654 RepID=A0A1A8ZHQ9_9ACTN|nr:MarR family transcriptional regulator [Micromonospora auratinigra]SBT43565.1 DNA-binding transcriptional regulator, MarR family [Micromonospora auratinigra]